MKVYINKYRRHWLSPYHICEKICFWREIDYDEPWVKAVNTVLEPIMTRIMNLLNVINPKIDYVKIDRWDTWSMDHTLSYIILPMLKQLRDTKHSHPLVDDEDAPEYMRSHMAQPKEHEWDWDDLSDKRWDYVLNEMIWAFEQKVDDESDNQFFDYSESNNKLPWDEGYVGPKYDVEGHKAWQKRKDNGFRLFGKYYEALWD